MKKILRKNYCLLMQKIFNALRCTTIPKKLHFIWVGDKPIPKKFEIYYKKWEYLYPDYDIKIWDDSLVQKKNVIPDNLKDLYYNYSQYPVFQADILRYCILYKYGGLYFDTDFEPLKKIKDIFLNFEFIGAIQNDNKVAIGFIGSAPGSEILENILTDLPIQIDKFISAHGEKLSFNYYLHGLTGPEIFDKYCSICKTNSNYFFFTPEYFYPYWHEDKEDKKIENFKIKSPISYGVHHWSKSWEDIESIEKDNININQINIPDIPNT